MTGVIDFYFDFISPFSYLAHCRLPDIAARHGREITYHVVDLTEIKLGGGNTGPTTREMPLKYRYSGTDMQRCLELFSFSFLLLELLSFLLLELLSFLLLELLSFSFFSSQ